jgi:CPA1 family monovalent cation:H+ antiporter
MNGVELIIILLAASAGLRVLARLIGVPHPALLVLGGLVLALIRQLPKIEIPPDALFILFVPPLLYWGSFTTSLRDFQQQLPAILRYGTLVVLLTTCVVAVVFHAITKEFTWGAAFLLGAIVSPPDPVAAIAVLRPLGAPRYVVSILEGEGLINDATALVCYQVALAAVVTGSFSPRKAAIHFIFASLAGVAIGLALGWLIAFIRTKLIGRFPVVENTISLLTPFLAYLPAQWLDASGVLAVVASGLYMGRMGPRIIGASTRVQSESMWTMVQFLLESLIFMMVGLELRDVVKSLQSFSLGTLLLYSALLLLVLIATRLLYTFFAVFMIRTWRAHFRGIKPRWKDAVFMGWAGMRGGDSMVIALALPLSIGAGRAFPARDLIIFLTFAAILGTLVLQGFTLVPLLKALKLGPDEEDDREEAKARHAAAHAGLRKLDQLSRGEGVDTAVLNHLRVKSEATLQQWANRDQEASATEHGPEGKKAELHALHYRALRTEMIQAEREEIISMRDEDDINDDVMRKIQRDLDLEAMLLESAGEDAPDSPYDEA